MSESIITLGIGATPESLTPFITTGLLQAEPATPVLQPIHGGMIGLALQLYESQGGEVLADFSDATDCQAETNEHGFRSLSCFVQMPLELAFYFSERARGRWLSLNYGAGVVWEGRVEDPTIQVERDEIGLEVEAFGSWRAFYDVPYTALWSASGTAGWAQPPVELIGSTSTPEKYETDNNNRLYIAPKKNETFQNSPNKVGHLGFIVPHGGSRQIVGVQFDYQIVGSTWQARLQRRDGSWANLSDIWTVNGSGSVQAGSVHLTLTACDSLAFAFFYNSGTPAAYTGETGDTYLKITNLRLVTTTTNRVNTTTTTTISAGSQAVTPASMAGIRVGQRLVIDSGSTPSESVTVTAVTSTTFTATFANGYSGTTTIQAHVVYADEIVKDLVAFVNGLNPAHLSASTVLIESPGLDLTDEVYEDKWPADIATKLAELGDNQSPPRLWEVGVWEAQRLHFRPRGSSGQLWAVDADELEVNSTINKLYNSAYAVFKDANNDPQRTAVADDAASQSRDGIVRRTAVRADTSSETQAQAHRDARLADGKTVKPRSKFEPEYILDEAGAVAPNFLPRAGQTMTARNLPPTLGQDVDRIRTFLLSETAYDAITDGVQPVPEEPLASLDFLVARKDEGF